LAQRLELLLEGVDARLERFDFRGQCLAPPLSSGRSASEEER
jgi:hypothetical protein